jgi:hypothetical protein
MPQALRFGKWIPAMLQYSLRTLFLSLLGIAIATWVIFVISGNVGVLVLTILLLIIPGLIAAGIVYFRGYPQAFCIGAGPTQAVMLFMLAPYFTGWPYRYPPPPDLLLKMKVSLVGALVLVLIAGLGGILIRYLSLSPGSLQSGRRVP